MSANTALTFSLATLVLLVLPGPVVMYVVTTSAARGRRTGLLSVVGVHLGTIVHVAAAMVGLSGLLVASASAFTAVKLAGAGYLIWLGIRALRSYRLGARSEQDGPIDRRPPRRVLLDGTVINVLNPKAAIFFLSFVPQFVDPGSANPVLDLAVLGGLFIGLGLVTDGCYALAGGWVGHRMRRSPSLQRRRDLLSGGTYLGLGLVTAVSGGRSS